MSSSAGLLGALERDLDGARVLGLELDLRYRVLAATLEGATVSGAEGADPRLQVLWFPIAEIRAILRREVDGSRRVEQFAPEQLLSVVERLGEPVLEPPLFDQPAPDPHRWRPQPSIEGRSDAPDGRSHRVTLELEGEDGSQLLLTATFDDVELRLADGTVVDWQSRS